MAIFLFIKKWAENRFLTALAVAFGFWLLYILRNIVAILFLSFILAASLRPIVEFFKKKKISPLLAVIIPYVLLFAILGGLMIPLIITFTTQIGTLTENLPRYSDRIENLLHLSRFGINIEETARKSLSLFTESLTQNFLAVPLEVFGAVISIFTVIVLSFYLLLDYKNVMNTLGTIVAPQKRSEGIAVMENIERKMGGWLRGQLILSGIVGVLVGLLMKIVNVEFPVSLGLLAGLSEFIPFAGPLIAGSIATLVALGSSPGKAVLVVIIFSFIQFLEGNILVPQIMKYSVKLDPILVLIGLLVGGELFGIVGIILSVPCIAITIILWKHFVPHTRS